MGIQISLKKLAVILQPSRPWVSFVGEKQHIFGGKNIKSVKHYIYKQVKGDDYVILKIKPQVYFSYYSLKNRCVIHVINLDST